MLNARLDSRCPVGWRFFGSACYFQELTITTRPLAQAACETYGGDLVTIRTPEVWAFLNEWVDFSDEVWLGLIKTAPGTTLVTVWTAEDEQNIVHGWIDADANEADYFGSSFISTSTADQSGELCFRITTSTTGWADTGCNGANGGNSYVCQKSLCPAGSVLHGTKCYQKVTTPATWTNAETDCKDNKRGHLATIDNKYDVSFLADYLHKSPTTNTDKYWIGLNDGASEGTFVWSEDPEIVISTGSTAEAGQYTNWGTADAGDDDGADCVAIQSDETWNDETCGTSLPYVCEIWPASPIQGAEVRVGSCDDTTDLSAIQQNAVCQTPVSETEEDNHVFNWYFRECDNNYYGQFVYIVTEDKSDTWFSLCEVEIWGTDIPVAKKPKVGFTEQTVSDLEQNLQETGTITFTVRKSDGSAENPTCASFDIDLQTGLSQAALEGICDGTEAIDYDLPIPYPEHHQDITFSPTDTADKTFSLTVCNDFIPAEDEVFGFKFTGLSPGLLAGDSDAVTYDTLTYTIENDDVTYCWKEIEVSAYENTRSITAVLTRYGYTKGTTTAYVRTLVDDVAPLATADVDYVSLSTGTPVEFGPDVTEVEVVVELLEDLDCETLLSDDETFKLMIESQSEGIICTDGDAVLKILSDDVIFRFRSPSDYVVSESTREVEVVVELVDGPLNFDAIIDVKSQPIIPVASASPEDYTAVNTPVTIPKGQTTTSLTVTVTDDKLVEKALERFQLVLVKNPLTLPACVLASSSVANVDIEDDDCCWTMDEERLSIVEGVSADVTVKCVRPDSLALTYPLTANLTISTDSLQDVPRALSQTDYTVASSAWQLVTITSGTSTTISVPTTADYIEESTEYFDVTLVDAVDGELCEPLTTTVAITNDDVTVRMTNCGDNNSVYERSGKLTVVLERTGDLSRPDSVLLYTSPITAQAGSVAGSGDYVSTNVVKTFGANERTVTHEIIINDDNLEESDETFDIELRNLTLKTFVDPFMSQCTVRIIDDDCTFFLSSPGGSSIMVSEGVGSNIEVIVSRMGYINRPASVYIEASTINGGRRDDALPYEDFEPLATNVTFRSGENSKRVDIAIYDDDIPEIVKYFKVKLSNADCSIDGDDTLVIGIEDNDAVVIRLRDPEVTVNEGVERACLILYRTGPLSRADVVSISVTPRAIAGVSTAATPNSDFEDRDFTVTFKPYDDEEEACVVVYDDTFEEKGVESFSVRISGLESSSTTELQATIDENNRETVVYIRDDDGTFQLSCPSRFVDESVGSVTCHVERTGLGTDTETAYISTLNGEATSLEDFEPLSGRSLTFAPNVQTLPFNVKIYDDKALEGPEGFFVYLASSSGNDLGQRVEFITIEDNDNTVNFAPIPDGITTENSVTVPESIESLRLTIQRVGYRNGVTAGATSVRVSTREITADSLYGASPAEGNNVDYLDINREVTFANGQTKLDIEVEIRDDEDGEALEAFEVTLSNPSPNGNNALIYPNVLMVFITDDDGGLSDADKNGDAEGGSDGIKVSQALILGIGGGVGLLVLVFILGLIACVGISRFMRTPAAAVPARREQFSLTPRGKPPPYYPPGNYPQVAVGGPPQGPPRAIRYPSARY